MIAPAMPAWGNMNQEGWQKVLDFSFGAGIVKDRSKTRRLRKARSGLISTPSKVESLASGGPAFSTRLKT